MLVIPIRTCAYSFIGHSSINGYYEDIFIVEAKFIQVFTYRLEWTSSDPLV